MVAKFFELMKANKFLLYIASAIIILVGYLITRVIGVIPTIAATIFFVGMYQAKDKRKYIVALKIMGVVVVVLGIALSILFATMEAPMH